MINKSCKTVGELIDFLAKIPRDTPFCRTIDGHYQITKEYDIYISAVNSTLTRSCQVNGRMEIVDIPDSEKLRVFGLC